MNITLATPFNLFGMDGLMIFLILLLLFGAKKLPELAKGLGQAVREFSKAKDDFETEVSRTPPPAAPPIEPPKSYAEKTPEDEVDKQPPRDSSGTV